jgi:hypothetical protein
MTRLVAAAAVFMSANLLHTIDHMRQGTERLTTEVFAGGTAITLAALVVLFLAVRGDSRAPLAAVVVGLSAALGVSASHVAPHWSAFSDPYPDLSLDALSWAVMLAEIAAGLALAAAGLRQGGWLRASTSS